MVSVVKTHKKYNHNNTNRVHIFAIKTLDETRALLLLNSRHVLGICSLVNS